jgi:hypothetical protein
MAGCTITKPTYNSSSPAQLAWTAIATASANSYIDVGKISNSKGGHVLFIMAGETTDNAAGTTWWMGTSGSACSGTSYARLYSGSKLGRMKGKVAQAAKATAYARFRTTGATHLVTMSVWGPFETARFKDSDGYINFSKGRLGSTVAHVAAILLP